MRRRIALGISFLLILGIPAGLVIRSRTLSEPRLVGHWVAEPYSTALVAPHSIAFRADGTGMDASGVGNFPIRWEPVTRSGGQVTVQVSAHPAVGYYPPRTWAIEIVDADSFRLDSRTYRRRRE